MLFGLRPVVDAMQVPPIRVLRNDAEPLPVSRMAAGVLAAALFTGIAVTAAVQSGSALRGLLFAGGLVAAAAALAWALYSNLARRWAAGRAAGAVGLFLPASAAALLLAIVALLVI